MRLRARSYRYVGPADLKSTVGPETVGHRIRTAADVELWLAACSERESAEPFTFVVDTEGFLRLAPRRSEHVACAGGELVLSAGEMSFTRAAAGWTVHEVSNQSTGYCPDSDSWPAVAGALDRAGLGHPDDFTHKVTFRRCPACQAHNVVHEEHFVCAICGGDLPEVWNVDSAGWVEA